jgi:hypothetical protein
LGDAPQSGVKVTTETKKTQRCAFVILSDCVVRAYWLRASILPKSGGVGQVCFQLDYFHVVVFPSNWLYSKFNDSRRQLFDWWIKELFMETLTFEVVDRHADERSVAASFINLAYKMGLKKLVNGISAKTFARQQMDRLEIGTGMSAVPWGSKRIVLPPSRQARRDASKLSTETKGERRPKQDSPACTVPQAHV